jgi:hypothetical protein
VLDACTWAGTGGSSLEVPYEGGLGRHGAMWQEEEGGGSDVASSGGSRSGTLATGGQAWLIKIEEVGR